MTYSPVTAQELRDRAAAERAHQVAAISPLSAFIEQTDAQLDAVPAAGILTVYVPVELRQYLELILCTYQHRGFRAGLKPKSYREIEIGW